VSVPLNCLAKITDPTEIDTNLFKLIEELDPAIQEKCILHVHFNMKKLKEPENTDQYLKFL